MKKTELEKQIDERLKEIGFPEPENACITPPQREKIVEALGLFYHGHTLVVDYRQPGHQKIYACTFKVE
jgi:hypothetical protein